jgi:lysophospholipase L1-like esterase
MLNKRSSFRQRVLFPFAVTLISLAVVDIGLRFLVTHSDTSYGQLFGRDLPPLKVIPYDSLPDEHVTSQYENLVVQGKRITKDDLDGRFRLDSLCAYVPRENSVSVNGWWQTNSLGARSRKEIPREVEPGKTRVLLFGESYTQGEGVPQEQTWASYLDGDQGKLDVVNFGVSAYGTGQTLLRFRQVRKRIEYQVVVFVLVPYHDLWRDINTVRHLSTVWTSYVVQPRFILDEGELKLVQSPYANGVDVFRKNYPTLSPELHTHLVKYDRFYYAPCYEPPPVISEFMLYKLSALMFYKMKAHRLKSPDVMYDPLSEHLQLTRAIIRTAKTETERERAKFVLVVLPVYEDMEFAKVGSSGRKMWTTMVGSFRNDEIMTLDLLPALEKASTETMDLAYDHSHFGPRMNREIATAVGSFLTTNPLCFDSK